MDKILVSVIIANKNGEKFLKRNIESLLAVDNNFELIIVDDKSEDKSIEVVEGFKKKVENSKKIILIKLDKNVGAAKARNIGVKRAKGKYLFFLDTDTVVKKSFVIEIEEFFKKYKKAGFGQAKLLRLNSKKFDYGGDYISSLGFLMERARGKDDEGQLDKEDKIFAMKSAAMVVKKEVFEKLGGFDEEFRIFWEDTDICWRAWLFGYENYFLPSIVVEHAFGTKEKEKKHYVDNKIYYNGCRNMISSQIKNLGWFRLSYILLINVMTWLTIALTNIFIFRFDIFFAMIKGIAWNLVFIGNTLKKRKKIQKERKISDKVIFKKVSLNRGINYYLGKFISYVKNEEYW